MQSTIDPDITRKRLKQMGEYIHDLEAKVRSKQNKLNSMQAGPKIEGNTDDYADFTAQLENGYTGNTATARTTIGEVKLATDAVTSFSSQGFNPLSLIMLSITSGVAIK
jgi:hypothetical protein